MQFNLLSRLSRSSKAFLSKKSFSTVTEGSKYSSNYKVYLKLPNGQKGSFFHDVPINFNKEKKTVNVLIEIPRWSNAKFEVNKQLEFNPITQDMKKGQLRFVKNLFPFKGYIHNYGSIPQTWDDPTVQDKDTGYKGDNDPIDVCEIGSKIAKTGDIFEAKVLGSLALIDDGELDWKVIVINIQDELSSELNDIEDVFKVCPGLLESTRRWFKDYKIPDGKNENKFGFNGEFLNVVKTLEIIEHSNQSWRKLIRNEIKGLKIALTRNSALSGTPSFTSFKIEEVVQSTPEKDTKIPESLDKIYYV